MTDVRSLPPGPWEFRRWADMSLVAAPLPKTPRTCQCVLTQDAIAGGDIHFHVSAACELARRLAALENA